MKYFVTTTTVMGRVTESVTPGSLRAEGGISQNWFRLETLSADTYTIFISSETNFQVLSNLDGLDRDRVPTPRHVGDEGDESAPAFDPDKLSHKLFKYLAKDTLVVVRGIYQRHDPAGVPEGRFDARTVYLLDSKASNYLFETDHWWLTQIDRLANGWLDVMFEDRRDYAEADFAELYRTQLNILGLPTDDETQEMATLSRLIYGLSSAYLLTGQERYRAAAAAGVKYQRDTFRYLDGNRGEMCIWSSAKQKSRHNRVAKLLFASQNPDDKDQIPLYEQIYALAGLTQYYRISNDPEILTDILRTVRAFNFYWLDRGQDLPDGDPKKNVPNGYFSHIDYATFNAGEPFLGKNCLRKNWNSIGDHMPAYLFNLLLAIDPIPSGRGNDAALVEMQQLCRDMIFNTTDLIRRHFPGMPADQELDSKEKEWWSPFVNERFFGDKDRDWKADHGWGWQKNRAIVGHNLKIAWNLTRAAHYFVSSGDASHAAYLMQLAQQLGDDMAIHGIDQHRGGCFDAVERLPQNGMPYEIVWLPTKDFWQQEQAILAYLVLFGSTNNPRYLKLARRMEAFWNLFFLDRDHWGIFFRVMEDGQPVIEGTYGDKGGHAISGYHSFELNFLAHIYNRVFVDPRNDDNLQDGNFALFFRPSKDLHLVDGMTTFNVLPDYFPPGMVELTGAEIGGVNRTLQDDERVGFFVRLNESDLGRELVAKFKAHRSAAKSPLEYEDAEIESGKVKRAGPVRLGARGGGGGGGERLPALRELEIMAGEDNAEESVEVHVPYWQRPR
jgi:mannose/cellobiose epimerase-like protein (N-acyl-D-glucosamine 2-epimerase family)